MKDPAVLWYFNDWHGGTITLTRHLKGCYMDLLHAQFNIGHLSLDEIKTVLGSDFGSTWPTLQKKFVKDESTGLYYNKRLVFEAVKRSNYTGSRRQNLKKKEKVSVHMENENENIFFENIPKDWDREKFLVLLKKWMSNRKRKPTTELIQQRIKELVQRYPKWNEAEARMTEVIGEGWLKFVYPDQPKKSIPQVTPEQYADPSWYDKA